MHRIPMCVWRWRVMRKNSNFKEGLIYYKIGRRRVLDISTRLGGWLDSIHAKRKDRRSERRCICFNPDGRAAAVRF